MINESAEGTSITKPREELLAYLVRMKELLLLMELIARIVKSLLEEQVYLQRKGRASY